jgi:hypothetical protein
LTVTIDFLSEDLDISSGQEVGDLLSSSEEASVGASLSSSDDSLCLPRWNCLPNVLMNAMAPMSSRHRLTIGIRI